ncbi:MAG: HAD family hydrolase [Nitrospirales bacterium]
MCALRAIIFDFDGVVADNEPVHFAMFQNVLAEIGIPLSESEYYAEYVGFDDKGCFRAVLAAHGRPAPQALVDQLIANKARAYLAHIEKHLVIFPGVQDLVRRAAARYRLAIASGALRHEIEYILDRAGLRGEFVHITSAEDVRHGKPEPEGYVHALQALSRLSNRPEPPLKAEDCLVIEDSVPGIQAGHAAGMKVLAVSNTHPVEALKDAEVVVSSLEHVDLDDVARRLWGNT